jgi:hypothetical protein
VLLERLRNEVTRLPAVRGFHVIASSALKLPLEGVLEPLVVRRGRGRGTDEDAAGCGGC